MRYDLPNKHEPSLREELCYAALLALMVFPMAAMVVGTVTIMSWLLDATASMFGVLP